MVAFDDLLHARLGGMQDAVNDWSETVKKLKTLQEKAENGMQRKAEKADWKGQNAGVTRPFIKKTAKEFGDAAKEAESIRNILRDAHHEFKSAKEKLQKIVDDAPGQGVRIDPDGTVSPLDDGPKAKQGDLDRIRVSIKEAVAAAAEADETSARALRTLTGKDENNFSGTEYRSLKQAAHAQDAEDAKAAAKLVAKGDGASSEEIARLNKYFTDNKGDAYFAERFALEVGVKGNLDYWVDMGDPSDGSRLAVDHQKQIKELQQNWSMTLAEATHSHSPAMERWKSDVISSGTDVVQSRGTSAYGFQVMSNLMRHGSFDTKFLKDYGSAVTVAERRMTHDGGLRPGQVWNAGLGMPPHLNWDGKDLGRDPMAGFMEALGHNSKASTDFFNSKIEVPSDGHGDHKPVDAFKYFTKDRAWVEDTYKDGYGTKYGYDSLGHALESAATGHAYDAPTEGLKDTRTLDNAKVVQKIVGFYGSDPKFSHEQGISDSLGKIGSAYIDEFNRSLEQDDPETEREVDNSPFGANLANGTSRFGSHYNDNLLFKSGDTMNFMSIVAQDKEGHAALSAAQSVYTAHTLGVVGPEPGAAEIKNTDMTDARTTVRVGAETHGILDHSRMGQIDQDYQKDSEEKKKAIAQSTEWIKFGTEAVVGGGVAIATDGVASPFVPLIADAAGSAVVSGLGMYTDEAAENHANNMDRELKKKYDALQSDTLAQGQAYSRLPVNAYATAPGWSEENSNFVREDLTGVLKISRVQFTDTDLPDPYKKDD
ncbi:hypothetical protein [Streptomyces sp. NBC_00566]|uniref:hypothetical protein n=1 Tax=Streptomyces sp. NBC_00566 TaxID=2975778 RepID=UPI002E81F310|nr:hypothetical protein [Streptomyces sp. NBC_00566]WUB86466.1 ribosome-recycling factor [Streptomyces sp. NBC_00566]